MRVPMRVLEEQENKEPIESTGRVPTKDPRKVKSAIEESPRNQ